MKILKIYELKIRHQKEKQITFKIFFCYKNSNVTIKIDFKVVIIPYHDIHYFIIIPFLVTSFFHNYNFNGCILLN